jgi:hypothetical protein
LSSSEWPSDGDNLTHRQVARRFSRQLDNATLLLLLLQLGDSSVACTTITKRE